MLEFIDSKYYYDELALLKGLGSVHEKFDA